MRKPSRRVVLAAFVLGVVGFAFGVWVLLHPASVFVQPWRAEQTPAPVAGILLGPYPVEADFVELKKRGVTTLISLLEPNVPYEKVLLEKERALAARHGMTVKNFPMGSILGQTFGGDYAKNSRAAAEAALAADGGVYIHCYLGLHRAGDVRRYLAEHAQVQTALFEARNVGADHHVEDRAARMFREGRFQDVLAALSDVADKSPRLLRLQGWSLYRLRRLDEARAAFAQALALAPDDQDARIGLAYCDLSQGRLPQAEAAFTALRRQHPDDIAVLEGLGIVYYRQARWPEAEGVLADALARNPGNGETRQMRERARLFMASAPAHPARLAAPAEAP